MDCNAAAALLNVKPPFFATFFLVPFILFMRRWGVHHTETLENVPRAAEWIIRPLTYKIMDNLSIVNLF